MAEVSLVSMTPGDREQFIRDNQEAFNYGALEEFGRRDDHFEEEGEIISRETIEASIDGGEAYRIMLDGKPVGGVVIRVDGERGDLDLLFVSPGAHSRGIGCAAWRAVERLHPEVTVWETVTPYFEKRNIHFYVNRCGFHIVEFYNSHHPDPNDPQEAGQIDEQFPEGMFRFEKVMKRGCHQEPRKEEPQMKLEKMTDFFAARIDGYDAHMKRDIVGASEFYAYTASLLPDEAGARILDLGCGTGLELEEYFARNPSAEVTGIDLSEVMLDALRAKFPDRALTLICGSYFDAPLGEDRYDGAVSVESLHHFPAEMKAALYGRLCAALKDGGVFVLTDYFAESEALERQYFREFEAMKAEQAAEDGAIYHYDTPLLVEHEMDILRRAGFRDVSARHQWGVSTYTVCARK